MIREALTLVILTHRWSLRTN